LSFSLFLWIRQRAFHPSLNPFPSREGKSFGEHRGFLVSSESLGLVFDPEAQTRRELMAERLNVEDYALCSENKDITNYIFMFSG
jgi:hypothetical protein